MKLVLPKDVGFRRAQDVKVTETLNTSSFSFLALVDALRLSAPIEEEEEEKKQPL